MPALLARDEITMKRPLGATEKASTWTLHWTITFDLDRIPYSSNACPVYTTTSNGRVGTSEAPTHEAASQTVRNVHRGDVLATDSV